MARKTDVVKDLGKQKCSMCKESIEINETNFARSKTCKSGFNTQCRKCINEKVRIAMKKKREEDEILKKVEPCDISEVVNKRHSESKNLKPIELNRKCTVERLGDAKVKGVFSSGNFIREYKSFYLFETSRGWKECFRKNDKGIGWTFE